MAGEGSGIFVESCGDRSVGKLVQNHRPGSGVLPAKREQPPPPPAGVPGQSFLPSVTIILVAYCFPAEREEEVLASLKKGTWRDQNWDTGAF